MSFKKNKITQKESLEKENILNKKLTNSITKSKIICKGY